MDTSLPARSRIATPPSRHVQGSGPWTCPNGAPTRSARGRGALVAVAGGLLRRQAEEDRGDADDEVWRPHVRGLVGEAEEPRRQREQRAGDDVDDVVDCHRRDLPDAELVVGEQAVADQPDSEHDRNDGRGGVLRELEDPRCGDEGDADDVVERRVDASRDEAHVEAPPVCGNDVTPSFARGRGPVRVAGRSDTLPRMDRPIRVVIAKAGLDGHDRGAKVIARALRDAGMEVIYPGLHQTPEQIVETVIQEDADAVGVSILSGAHMTLVPRILDLLRAEEAEDVLVVVGGTIPADDAVELKKLGVADVFGPGARTTDIVDFLKGAVAV